MPRLTTSVLLTGAVLLVTGSCIPCTSLAFCTVSTTSEVTCSSNHPNTLQGDVRVLLASLLSWSTTSKTILCQHSECHCVAEYCGLANPLHTSKSQTASTQSPAFRYSPCIHSFKDSCILASDHSGIPKCSSPTAVREDCKCCFAGASAASAPRKLLQAFCVSEYSQCGGTTCPGGNCPASSDKAWACCQQSDFSCQRQTEWYWQCRPGSAKPAPAPSSDTQGTTSCHTLQVSVLQSASQECLTCCISLVIATCDLPVFNICSCMLSI